MTCNIGTADRTIRLVLGAVLVLLALATGFAAATPWLWWVTLVAGIVMIGTAGLRFCPLYTLLGVRTCRT